MSLLHANGLVVGSRMTSRTALAKVGTEVVRRAPGPAPPAPRSGPLLATCPWLSFAGGEKVSFRKSVRA